MSSIRVSRRRVGLRKLQWSGVRESTIERRTRTRTREREGGGESIVSNHDAHDILLGEVSDSAFWSMGREDMARLHSDVDCVVCFLHRPWMACRATISLPEKKLCWEDFSSSIWWHSRGAFVGWGGGARVADRDQQGLGVFTVRHQGRTGLFAHARRHVL